MSKRWVMLMSDINGKGKLDNRTVNVGVAFGIAPATIHALIKSNWVFFLLGIVCALFWLLSAHFSALNRNTRLWIVLPGMIVLVAYYVFTS